MNKLTCKLCSSTNHFSEIGTVSISGVTYKVFNCSCGTKNYVPIK